jgi:hypothetical protein
MHASWTGPKWDTWDTKTLDFNLLQGKYFRNQRGKLGLAVYGFIVSLGGQSLFGEWLFGDE